MNANILSWITSNAGYSFLLNPSAELLHYTDAYGIKRPLVYHGAKNTEATLEGLKTYVNWRLEQVENYPEITFSKDFKIVKINLIEKDYERI